MVETWSARHPKVANGQVKQYPLTVAEYFAGIGLFRMGLEKAGWQVAYANDWSQERAQMYAGFFGTAYPVKDIFEVDAAAIPPVTLATCSFPCIDLSLAGNLQGLNGKHSSAFWGFYEILRAQGSARPPMVLLENVAGWLSSNAGGDFYAVATALNKIGYACDAFALNARSFLPQSRPRIFMLGVAERLCPAAPELDASAHRKRSQRLFPARLRQLVSANPEIQWVRLAIPDPPAFVARGFSEEIAEPLPPDDSRWWPREKVDKHLAMMSPAHWAMVQDLAGQEWETRRTFYRRRRATGQKAEVRSDDIAGCLRTAVGGSGKQFLVAAGKDVIRMRTLTPREYARLQGVPDDFPIVANTERQSLNAFGDAVCVPAVSWIAEQVLNPLATNLNTPLPGLTSVERAALL